LEKRLGFEYGMCAVWLQPWSNKALFGSGSIGPGAGTATMVVEVVEVVD